MNVKKGLIGLFSTIFLLSGIVMVMLVLDDQHDLSSRASGPSGNKLQPALPGIVPVETDIVWSGNSFRLPISIKYNSSVWLPPIDNVPVFYHLQSPVTVRIVSEKVDLDFLRNLLGKDFIFVNTKKDDLTTSLPGWKVQRFIFTFFGEEKNVDVWTSPDKLSFISVAPSTLQSSDVQLLLSSVNSTINTSGAVKGISSPDETARLAALIRPSVVLVLNKYCTQAKFVSEPGFALSGKSYPFCIASTGSGFFVNPHGYIATNGHVVKNLPTPSLFYGVISGSLDDLLIDALQLIASSQAGYLIPRDFVAQKVAEAHTSKEGLYQLAAFVDTLYSKKIIEMATGQNNYYVQAGNTAIQYSKSGVNVGPDILEAKFIDADYKEVDPKEGFSSSDVALLQVTGDNYPALPLGSIQDVSAGSSIEVVGFPGLVMGSNSSLLDTSANSEPTFTRGVVSAFKQAKGDKKNLIQTDASINHGNSGGPAVSTDGKVIGIATYGLTPDDGGGNYNFLRDIGDLKALMDKNKITAETGSTYITWKSGLESFWLSYFRYAKNDFSKIATNYPIHPTVGKYLSEAKSKVGTSEDITPRFTRVERRVYMVVSGLSMIFSVGAIIFLLVVGVPKKAASKARAV